MIDEDRTMQLFGYKSTELSPRNHKKIVAVCDECGKYRVLRKDDYRDLCHQCSLKGKRNPFFGKKHSEETCKKISKVNKGNTGQSGEKNGMWGRHGEKNPRWKGGITKWRNQVWNSTLYKAWRAAVFKRDNYTCQMCGDNSGGNLQAHHIQPFKDHKNDLLIFDIDNGITLCKDCHSSIRNHEYEFIDQFKEILKR